MIFPSEKRKELLRYATRNIPATCDADGTQIPTQQPQPPLHPHRLHPQQLQLSDSCCCLFASESAAASMRQLNTPPPPYCSIPCSMDCSGSYRLPPPQGNRLPANDHVSDMSVESDSSYTNCGSSYASSGADLLSDENEQYPPTQYYSQAAQQTDTYANLNPNAVRLLPTTPAAAPATTFAATAANMFRNCCGGGGGHTTDSSSNGSLLRTSPQSGSRRHFLNHRQRTVASTLPPTCPLHPHGQATLNQALNTARGGEGVTTAMRHRTLSQNLNALLKPFKNKQINELLQAVKSRVDPPTKSNATNVSSSSPSYLQCILIKCISPVVEDQHVTTCQMFFWSDLRCGGELRRLPTCPSARDCVYVCCNPLHWYRIMQPIDSGRTS